MYRFALKISKKKFRGLYGHQTGEGTMFPILPLGGRFAPPRSPRHRATGPSVPLSFPQINLGWHHRLVAWIKFRTSRIHRIDQTIRQCLIEKSRDRCKPVESRAQFDSSAGTEILPTHDGKVEYDFRFRWACQRVGYRTPGWLHCRRVANVGGRRSVRASFVGRRRRRAPCWRLPARLPVGVSTCFGDFGTRSSLGSRTVATTPPERSALSLTGSASRRTQILTGTPGNTSPKVLIFNTHDIRSRNRHRKSTPFSGASFRRRFSYHASGLKISGAENKCDWWRRRR